MSIFLIAQQSFVLILRVGNDFLACHFTFLNTKKHKRCFIKHWRRHGVMLTLPTSLQRCNLCKNVWRMCFICDQLTLRRPSFSFRATARRWRCRQYARTTAAGRVTWWWSSARRATCMDMCWPTDTSTFSVGFVYTASVTLQCKKAWSRNSQIINHWPLVYYVKVEKTGVMKIFDFWRFSDSLHTKTTHNLTGWPKNSKPLPNDQKIVLNRIKDCQWD